MGCMAGDQEEMTFGRYFQRVRNDRGMTLRDVSKILNMAISHVSDIEHGRRIPLDPVAVEQFAIALELPAETAKRLVQLAVRDRKALAVRTWHGNKDFNDVVFALYKRSQGDSVDWKQIKRVLREALG